MEEFQIDFRNSKNQKLVGVLCVPGKNNKYPTVIICHGMPRDKVGQYRIHVRTARKLCGKNFVVLRFDFSGHGDSEGDFEYVTHTQALDDLDAAINFIKNLNFVDKSKIGIVGHSFGGEIALLRAINDTRIKTLVLHAPRIFYNRKRIKKEIKELKRKGYLEWGSLRLKLNFLKDRLKYLAMEDAKNLTIPVLIIHGTNDKIINYKDSIKFIKRLKSKSKKIALLKNIDHDFSKYVAAERLMAETVKWLVATLK